MKKSSSARWHAWGGMLATVGGLVAAGVAIYQMRLLGIPVGPALSGGASLFWIALALLVLVTLVALVPILAARVRRSRHGLPSPIPLHQAGREREEQDAVASGEGRRSIAKVTPLRAGRGRPPDHRKRHP